MRVTETRLPGVLILEPRVFRDERGFLERLGIRAALWIRLRAINGTPAVLLVMAPSTRRLNRR